MARKTRPTKLGNFSKQDVILILADISGYTSFMLSNRTSIRHAPSIITELTKAIIAGCTGSQEDT